jgi:hypothetical protein
MSGTIVGDLINGRYGRTDKPIIVDNLQSKIEPEIGKREKVEGKRRRGLTNWITRGLPPNFFCYSRFIGLIKRWPKDGTDRLSFTISPSDPNQSRLQLTFPALGITSSLIIPHNFIKSSPQSRQPCRWFFMFIQPHNRRAFGAQKRTSWYRKQNIHNSIGARRRRWMMKKRL